MQLTIIRRFSQPIQFFILIAILLIFSLLPILSATLVGLSNAGILAITFALAIMCIALIAGMNNKYVMLVFLIIVLAVQPILTVPLASTLGSMGVKIFVATKEVYIAMVLVVLFLKNFLKIRWHFVDLVAAFYLLICLLYFLVPHASVAARILALRGAIMFVIFYFVGRLLYLELSDIRWFLRTVVIIAFGISIFGFIEYFVFNESVWLSLGIRDYYDLKFGENVYKTVGALPLNWYTPLRGEWVRRAVSSICEPTSLSFYLALPVLALFYIPRLIGRKLHPVPITLVMLIVIGGLQIASVGRGGILVVLVGLTMLSLSKYPKVSIGMGIPLLVLIVPSIAIFDVSGGSNLVHLLQTAKGLNSIIHKPIGHGLGTSGSFVQNYGLAADDEKMNDSILAEHGYQMGIPGFGSYMAFFLALMVTLASGYLKEMKNRDEDGKARPLLLGVSLALAFFSTSLLANSPLAPISSGLPMILCGALVGQVDKKITG